MIDLKDVGYSILSCVRTVLCKSNSANFVLSCHEFSREISENFVRNYHCQTIFRAKFQGNIAQYFRRTNEKLLFWKFAEAKFRAATNKLITNVSLSAVKHTCKQTKIYSMLTFRCQKHKNGKVLFAWQKKW